jgi:hypothetical protein
MDLAGHEPKRRRSAAFIGNMNAMPMTYALALRTAGWDVKYIVDSPRSDLLSRPEYKFPQISYPYPEWIIERRVRSPAVAALLPGTMLRDVVAILRRCDVVVASGLFLPFSRFLRSDQRVVFISHGSDVEVWCDQGNIDKLSELFTPRIGKFLARRFVRAVVGRMVEALRRATAIVTFPAGLSPHGDLVLQHVLAGTSVRRVPRYDISFADLPVLDGPPTDLPAQPLRVICGTRHTFRAHPGLSEFESKGTDRIIRGLGCYARASGKSIEVHFFEKGRDVLEAKRICQQEGIAPFVIWHREMPFHEYLALHRCCHVAVDQVGPQWVGTGMYAMYMHMPLIANSRKEVLDAFWGEASPICHAETPEDVADWLRRLQDAATRDRIGRESHAFAVRHFGGSRTTDAILKLLDEAR